MQLLSSYVVRTRIAMADEIIRNYLDRPPYYGRSGYQHVTAVKALCGPTCTWDPVRKLWGTKCTEALQDLAGSGKWHPVGIEYEWKGQFLKAAQEHRALAQAQWMAEEEAKKKQKAEADAAAAALRRRSPASWIIGSSVPKKSKAAGAPVPTAPAAPPPVPSHNHPAQKANEKTREGVEPTEAEVNECARLGITDEAIAFSDALNELGPRGTLSNEGRVLRWCTVLASDARYEVGKRCYEDYFNEEMCLMAAEEKQLEWASRLNEQAIAHAKGALA